MKAEKLIKIKNANWLGCLYAGVYDDGTAKFMVKGECGQNAPWHIPKRQRKAFAKKLRALADVLEDAE